MSELNRVGGAGGAKSRLLQFQPKGKHVELDESSQADAPGKGCRTDESRTVGSSVGGIGQPGWIAEAGQRFSEARSKAPDHVCPGSKKNRSGAACPMGKVEGGQADEVIHRYTHEYGFMPKKKTTSVISKLTEVE